VSQEWLWFLFLKEQIKDITIITATIWSLQQAVAMRTRIPTWSLDLDPALNSDDRLPVPALVKKHWQHCTLFVVSA